MNIHMKIEVARKQGLIMTKKLTLNETNESLSMFNILLSMDINSNLEDKGYDLVMRFSDNYEFYSKILIIEFKFITNLNFLNFGGENFHLLDFVIEKNTDGWENVNYDVFCIDNDLIDFRCKKFEAEIKEIKSFDEIYLL